MIPIVQKELLPRLKKIAGGAVIRSRTIKTTGLTESEVDKKTADLLKLDGAVTMGIYARPGQVDLRITASAPQAKTADRLIAAVEKKLRRRLGSLIYGTDDDEMETVVGQLLRAKRKTVATAESCTGGLIGHRITEVAGSSDYYAGGVIAYANGVKQSALGVPASLLKKEGAVSAQTAQAMARGIREKTGASIGLAVTGIAGPGGGTKQKPVGLVYIGLADRTGTKSFKYQFSGTRAMVKNKTAQAALNLLRLHLLP
jgi:nicotinamide-nucleotide amidase